MAYANISKPSLHFNSKLYTGNSSTQSITGVGFQPDLTWIKDRIGSTEVYSHYLFDAVRGATKWVKSNSTDAESTTTDTLTAFDSDGFSLGANAKTNASGDAIVSWNWKANGAGSANTDGSINTTSTSVNTTSGFSISKYTGDGAGSATVGHGLGVAPSSVIIKNVSNIDAWQVWTTGATRLVLNSTSADYGNHGITKGTTTITLPSSVDNAWNASSNTYIMYCFAEKTGFSKFGTYTGNGNDDCTFIYTGFAPAFLLLKETSAGTNDSWFILDNKRNTYNPRSKNLRPNSTDAEADSAWMIVDFLSNGFKINDDDASINESGKNYIYMAFAAEPLVANVGSSIPATAK